MPRSRRRDGQELMRPVAYFSIMLFIVGAVWRTISQGKLPENAFLNIVGYAFSVDWSTTPWQLLGFGGSVLSLVVFYWIDWSFKKYITAEKTQDGTLRGEALRDFEQIERVKRIRSLLFLAYCALVGFQALLVLNTRSCWFIPGPHTQGWAEWLYGNHAPDQKCVSRSRVAARLAVALLIAEAADQAVIGGVDLVPVVLR